MYELLNLSRAILSLLSVYTNYNYLQHNWLKQTINPEAYFDLVY